MRIEWEKSLPDAQKLKAAGLGDLVANPPDLTPLALQAHHCWSFCGGWNPDRLPFYTSLYEVEDLSLLVELLMHIRRQTHATGPAEH